MPREPLGSTEKRRGPGNALRHPILGRPWSALEPPWNVPRNSGRIFGRRFEYENSRGVYADMDAFLEDVIAIERQMIAEAVAAGFLDVAEELGGFGGLPAGVEGEDARSGVLGLRR